MLRAALPKTLISFEASGNAMGHYDEVRIRHAMSNLISNAYQYQRRGTDILVRVEGQADCVVLSVSNEGPDIESSVLATLFEPFQRKSAGEYVPSKRNLGLGLFVVREIARGHGGEVDVVSASGRIAFEVRLPRADSHAILNNGSMSASRADDSEH